MRPETLAMMRKSTELTVMKTRAKERLDFAHQAFENACAGEDPAVMVSARQKVYDCNEVLLDIVVGISKNRKEFEKYLISRGGQL